MAYTGDCQLIAAHTLPSDFFATEHYDKQGHLLDVREPGDDLVERAARALQRSMATYGACWLYVREQRNDTYFCQVVEVVEADVLASGRMIPSSDLCIARAVLPIFFTEQEFAT